MEEKEFMRTFAMRLSSLRLKKGVSARDMSLSIGQNAGYINNIETLKAMPSMMGFYYICDYLGITPKEFFDYDNVNPVLMTELISKLSRLNEHQMNTINMILDEFLRIR